MRPRRALLVLVLAALAVSGCGRGRGTVIGKVTCKGRALTAGTVSLFGADNKVRSAPIGPDGSYRIGDVPVGPVNIAVATPPAHKVPTGPRMDPANMGNAQAGGGGAPGKDPKADAEGARAESIPTRYRDPEKSNLRYQVEPGEQQLDLPLD
jgi:hypothetical protein